MRNVFPVACLLLAVCSDPDPMPPADGSVQEWEKCLDDDGQWRPELCAPGLICQGDLCVQRCTATSQCPVFAGFDSQCGFAEDGHPATEEGCQVLCDDVCPELDGAPLRCSGLGFCVFDPTP